jgi:hypothetical protein
MNETNETQESKKREFFKVDDSIAELNKIIEEVEELDFEEIAKQLPDKFLRSIYASMLYMGRELSVKQRARRTKAAMFFLGFLKSPKFISNLQFLEREANKAQEKEKTSTVEWKDKGSKKEKKK